MVRSTEASVPDRNVEPAFEVGDDVFERHVEEGQGGLYPAVVVRGVHLFDDHASGGLVEDQPFVGPEPDGLLRTRRADADRAAVERRFGDAAGALVAGVERGSEHFDLHAVHVDDEGMRRVALPLRNRLRPSSVTRRSRGRMFRDRSGGSMR